MCHEVGNHFLIINNFYFLKVDLNYPLYDGVGEYGSLWYFGGGG